MRRALLILLPIILIILIIIMIMYFSEQKHSIVGRELIEEYYFKYVINHNLHKVPLEYDVIPNEETAIKVAIAILSPIYGERKIKKQRPFEAHLISDYWVVCGTLPHSMEGGVAKIIISKKDGKIVHITHSK